MATRAANVLKMHENMLKGKTEELDPASDDQALNATPSSHDVQPGPDQPGDTSDDPMKDVAKAVGMMREPTVMADALDQMADMTDRYMNEDDEDTFTPADDDEKAVVTECGMRMRESAMAMRGMRK